jgi:hypothetical protein
MPTIIVEGPVQAQFETAGEPVEVATPDGRVLGVFTPASPKPGEELHSAGDPLSLINE